MNVIKIKNLEKLINYELFNDVFFGYQCYFIKKKFMNE